MSADRIRVSLWSLSVHLSTFAVGLWALLRVDFITWNVGTRIT